VWAVLGSGEAKKEPSSKAQDRRQQFDNGIDHGFVRHSFIIQTLANAL
jgi:hypothetical protein